MDGFSVTGLTSLCTSITSRAASGAAELQTFNSDSRFNALQSLADSLAQLGYVTPLLEHALCNATSISQNLQTLLNNILTTVDAAITKLHKQLMRISQENIHLLDHDYVSKHHTLLEAYADVAEVLIEVLSL